MNKTAIEWTDFSANPLKYRRKSDGKLVWACVKTSPGCAHCYSEAIALRFDRGKLFNATNMEELEPFLDERELHKILLATRIEGVEVSGSRLFLGDMTDVFGAWVPDALLDRLFAVFALRPDITFQILTKRADRLARYFSDVADNGWDELYLRWGSAAGCFLDGDWIWKQGKAFRPRIERFISVSHQERDDDEPPFTSAEMELVAGPLSNVWLGVSVEDRKRKERIDILRTVPAAVRFLSIEPLLEDLGTLDLAGIGWCIVGGESGRNARPMHPAWVRSIRDQCQAAGTPFFFKQHGEYRMIEGAHYHSEATAANLGYGGWQSAMQRVGKHKAGRLLDGREWNEFPQSKLAIN